MKFLITTINLFLLCFMLIYYVKSSKMAQYIKTQEILFSSQKGIYSLLKKSFAPLSILYLLIVFLLEIFTLINLQTYFNLILIFFVLIFFVMINSYTYYIIFESSILYLFTMKEYKFSEVKDIKIIPISKNGIRIKLYLNNKIIDMFFEPDELILAKNFLETKVLNRSLSTAEIELLSRK
ncbi:hypothetical protein [uncultured Clostridium sp.]|uniref:hypothetical protein n=1 Tax=uncultured Clostridium sp. TaxID=59620 RepID=UPI0026307100|nr:hypothetical protein [uncultured Clostridium sp.]